MSKIDLYPTVNASPKDAKVATGTAFSAEKVGLDTNILGGSITVGTAAAPSDYDSAEVQYPSATQEIYIYKKGASTVKTVTINYTSSAKDYILNWTIT
jgi:hypothetical protein